MKVATVCTGIGSPEMAIRNLGIEHEIVFGCEIDKYARETYLANFEPGFMVPDMTKCDWEDEKYYSDLFIGGIPCQAFSLAGKRLGELDPRGLLFFDFYRYVKNQQPKYFIIENVKGLLSDNDGNTFQNWINLLGQSVNGDMFMFPHEDSLMYNLHWQVLNTKDYGIPQNRERVFLIGIRNDLPNSFVFPKGVPLKLRLKDILEEEVDEKYYLSEKMLEYFNTRADNFNSGKINYKGGDDIASCINASSKSLDISDNILKVLSTVQNEDNLIKIIGHSGSGGQKGFIYDTDGISSCLSATDYKQPKQIQVNSQNAEVIQINPSTESGGVQPYQQNRIYDSEGIAPALCRGKSDLNVTEIIQLNNPTHSNDRVYSDEGISPTLNTMQGGNRQPFIAQYTGIAVHPLSKKLEFDGFKDGECPTLLATDYKAPKCVQYSDYRIRKLTPLECFRLQGFPDSYIKPVSNSQLYKQAGNSISVPVIQAILKNLLTV